MHTCMLIFFLLHDVYMSHFQLVEGVYQLKLRVSSLNSQDWGEAYVNVTVHPADRVNSPPVPVILPSNDVTVCFSLFLLSLPFFIQHSDFTWILHVKPSSTNWLWIVIWQPISFREPCYKLHTLTKKLPCGINVLPFLSPPSIFCPN